jgi:hypothetical protein
VFGGSLVLVLTTRPGPPNLWYKYHVRRIRILRDVNISYSLTEGDMQDMQMRLREPRDVDAIRKREMQNIQIHAASGSAGSA